MNAATRPAREAQPCRFYAPDYRRRLREAGALSSISASANVVLAALCDRANAAGVAWPSVETIARDYGLGESTVRRALGELVAVGLVLAVRRAGKVNRYVLTTQASETLPQGAKDDGLPSRIGRPPRPKLAPIMNTDHDQDHETQHDSAEPVASVVVEDRTSTKNGIEDTAPITMLEPELVDRVRAIGLAASKVNRFGAERVRQVLDGLETERARKVIAKPAGWVMSALVEGWEVAGAAKVGHGLETSAALPPVDTRWAREKETGLKLEVLDVNETRVQLSGGVAVPAHYWGAWEWFADHPDHSVANEEGTRVLAVGDDPDITQKRGALARVAAWSTIRMRTEAELEAKLAAAGLTVEQWRAYKALATGLEAGALIR